MTDEHSTKTWYSFFVSYSHLRGHGSTEIRRVKPSIDDYEELREIRKLIELDDGLTGVVIMNVQQFPMTANSPSDDVSREIVSKLAAMDSEDLTHGDDNEYPISCVFCETVSPHVLTQHAPDCLWLQARQAVGK